MSYGLGRGRAAVDLETVRATLEYMKSDIARVRGLERVALALEVTIREIDRTLRPAAETGSPEPVDPEPQRMRFVPWHPGR
jgi:hypothetical protein